MFIDAQFGAYLDNIRMYSNEAQPATASRQ
jgi:hypothetical protein